MSPLDAIHNPDVSADAPPTPAGDLPRALLYATGARIGGTGLDATSLQDTIAAHRAGCLARAIGYADQQDTVPADKVHSLRFAPVRLLSFFPSKKYYAAKKVYADFVAHRHLLSGRYDAFHGWSGDALHSLITARQNDIPSLLNIPTWHRNKGKTKPFITQSERHHRALTGLEGFRAAFRISRQRMIAEYELADAILVPSATAARTFLDVGTPPEKLHYVGRGVDPQRFTPGTPPSRFRLVFVGALIPRKGLHHLLAAWRKLALKDAELVLVGTAHGEVRRDIRSRPSPGVRVTGFTRDVVAELQAASAFVFPSECEGFAKATLEAAACGLPLISTPESGDALVDGTNGVAVAPNDPDALAGAIEHLYRHPDLHAAMGEASRRRVLDHFTWDHYHRRVTAAYASVFKS